MHSRRTSELHMPHRTTRVALGSALLAVGAAAPAPAQIQYRVREIPIAPDGIFFPVGLNNSDIVVGRASYVAGAGSVSRGVLWSPASGFTQLPALPGGTYTDAAAINNASQVAGHSMLVMDTHAVRWGPGGAPKDVGHVVGQFSAAYGINGQGDVVGEAYLDSPDWTSAFVWTEADGMRSLGNNGYDAWGCGVNSSGVVVGTRIRPEAIHGGQEPDCRGYVWTAANGMRDIDIDDRERTFAFAINNRGQIVGIAQNRAFVSDPVIGLILLPPAAGAAYAVNQSGSVVGIGVGGPIIWDVAHGLRSLNAMIPHPITGDYVSAVAINDAGHILVTAENLIGNPKPSRSYLLIPIAEAAPATRP
jgi:hypothetical protein